MGLQLMVSPFLGSDFLSPICCEILYKKRPVIGIIRLMGSDFFWTIVIPLSSAHSIFKATQFKTPRQLNLPQLSQKSKSV
jgi:hypothetical protein